MYDTQRLKFGHTHDKTPPNLLTDFAWIRQNQEQLLAQYGECAIVVYKEQVIGVGITVEEAILVAEQNLPPEIGEITPIQTWLSYPLVPISIPNL